MRSIAAEQFDALMQCWNSPAAIVTTANESEKAGCLVTFAAQVSIEPRLFVACLSTANRTAAVAHSARYLAVHVLPCDATGLARLFGSESGDWTNKFELQMVDWAA